MVSVNKMDATISGVFGVIDVIVAGMQGVLDFTFRIVLS